MSHQPTSCHLVLDHNYPAECLEVPWPSSVRLSRLRDIDARLTRDFEDWQVLLALHQRGDVDAFVTQDAAMLSLPTEMVVLSKCGLCLVVTKDTGHSPLRALGLLMAGLETAVRRIENERPAVLVLSTSVKSETADSRINGMAGHSGLAPPELIEREMTRVGALSAPVLT
jgi:hypothetical protein